MDSDERMILTVPLLFKFISQFYTWNELANWDIYKCQQKCLCDQEHCMKYHLQRCDFLSVSHLGT